MPKLIELSAIVATFLMFCPTVQRNADKAKKKNAIRVRGKVFHSVYELFTDLQNMLRSCKINT